MADEKSPHHLNHELEDMHVLLASTDAMLIESEIAKRDVILNMAGPWRLRVCVQRERAELQSRLSGLSG